MISVPEIGDNQPRSGECIVHVPSGSPRCVTRSE